MFIKDLQARQGGVEVEAAVVEISEPREFNKMGNQGKVANAIIKDDTGKVKLTLWNEQIEKIKVGDIIKIEKGYVGEWQGELQLSTGKFGTLEVVGDKPSPSEETAPVTEESKITEPEPSKIVENASEPSKTASAEQTALDVEEEDVL